MLPAGCGDAANVMLGDNVYIYRATNQQGAVMNDLYWLDSKTMVWHKESVTNPQDGPQLRTGCGMMALI